MSPKNKLILITFVLIALTAIGLYLPKKKIPAVPLKNQAANNQSEVKVLNVQSEDTLTLPFVIKGEAKGSWFFEATFPIEIISSSNQSILTRIQARAESDWTTDDFVPFSATIPEINYSGDAILKLMNDNPSGLPEKAKSIEIPITIAPKTNKI